MKALIVVLANNNLVIYIIDDDASILKGLSRLLHSAGLNYQAYPSAQAFLAKEHNEAIGCILTDITMPTMNGLEFVARLKEKNNKYPIIALSARDDEETHKLIKGLGVQFFLRKPVDDQALIDAINWVMRIKKQPD